MGQDPENVFNGTCALLHFNNFGETAAMLIPLCAAETTIVGIPVAFRKSEDCPNPAAFDINLLGTVFIEK